MRRPDRYDDLRRAWGKPDRFERNITRVTIGLGCAWVFVFVLFAIALLLGVIWLAGQVF